MPGTPAVRPRAQGHVGRLQARWPVGSPRTTLIVLGLALLYVATRLALLWRFPAFWDESFYGVETQKVHDDPAFRFIALADDKGPLLNWIASPLLGVGAAPLTAVRAVSFASGAVAMTMVGLVARRLAGTSAALAAAGLYAVLPIFLVHDSLGLIDPLVTAAAMTALYLQLRIAERPRLDLALLLGLALGAGMLAKQSGFFALALLPVSAILLGPRDRLSAGHALRWAGYCALAVAVGLLVYSIQTLSPLFYSRRATAAELQHYRSIGDVLRHPLATWAGSWPGFSGALAGYLTLPLLLLAALGAFLGLRRRPRPALVVLAWAAVPLAGALLLLDFGYTRYILSAVPPICILIAVGLLELANLARRRGGSLRPVAAVALALAPALAFDARVLASPGTARYAGDDDWQFVAGWPAGTGLPKFAHELERRAPPGESIVASVVIPWGLVVRFDHPRLVPTARLPFRDDVIVEAGNRRLRFVPTISPLARRARFLVLYDTLPFPRAPDQARFRQVAAFRRPRGGTFKGDGQPKTTVALLER